MGRREGRREGGEGEREGGEGERERREEGEGKESHLLWHYDPVSNPSLPSSLPLPLLPSSPYFHFYPLSFNLSSSFPSSLLPSPLSFPLSSPLSSFLSPLPSPLSSLFPPPYSLLSTQPPTLALKVCSTMLTTTLLYTG